MCRFVGESFRSVMRVTCMNPHEPQVGRDKLAFQITLNVQSNCKSDILSLLAQGGPCQAQHGAE